MAKKTTTSTTPTKGVAIAKITGVIIVIVGLLLWWLLSGLPSISLWWLISIPIAGVLWAAWYFRKRSWVGSLRYKAIPWKWFGNFLLFFFAVLGVWFFVWYKILKKDLPSASENTQREESAEYVARPIEVKEGINYFKKGRSYRYYRDSRKIFVELIEDGTAGLRFQNEEAPTEYWDVEYNCKNNKTKTYIYGAPSKNGGYHLITPTETVVVKISYEY